MAFDALLGSDDGVIQTLERNAVFCWRHENSLEHRQHAGGNTMGRYVGVEPEGPGNKLVAEHRVELEAPCSICES